MIFVESASVDPGWNLAMEEYLAGKLRQGEKCLFLWQNDRTIVVGKNQNTLGEINVDYVREHNILVCRRLSGGGTVYHDLGNLNYTLISDAPGTGGIAFAPFCEPVVEAIHSFGVDAQLSDRNDILVNGKKISGNAQYYQGGRVIHHGTILFSSDLNVLAQALQVDRAKFQGKGIASVESRVTNLQEHLPCGVSLADFRQRLLETIMTTEKLEPLRLTQEDLTAIGEMKRRYDSWEWNYGYSPAFQRSVKRRIPGCGTVQVDYEMERGILRNIRIQGDFFGERDIAELEASLQGCSGSRDGLLEKLREIPLQAYVFGMNANDLVQMIAPRTLRRGDTGEKNESEIV